MSNKAHKFENFDDVLVGIKEIEKGDFRNNFIITVHSPAC